MTTSWIAGAERLGDGVIGGAMDTPGAPPRTVWHTTESGAGDAAFDSVGAYLISACAEPHLLYDPTTDRLGQFGPLDRSARALRNDGSLRTNRTGRVCVQVEVLARAHRPFTDYWRPGPRFAALLAAIRSWGVPDQWPAGALASSPTSPSSRERGVWQSAGGHYGHANVPGNDHWDPGAISRTALLEAGRGTGPGLPDGPSGVVVSLSRVIAAARTDPAAPQGSAVHRSDVLPVERALVAEGLLAAPWADGSFGTRTVTAYAAWQRRCGFSGPDADGIPGRSTLQRLGAAHGFTVRL
ncbi:peptidoglycan-binding domain-containing protein [Streptomyces sp. NPDC058525]|uniref:peptidoglycan-binding domain-containing protein n=1 Tax=unclassified Streptomyces TaxID=2593676 RepID=UPI003667B6BB